MLQRHVLRLHALGQRGPLRLGRALDHLAQLQVRTVLAGEHEDRLARFRVTPELVGACDLLPQDVLDLLRREVGRRRILGNRRLHASRRRAAPPRTARTSRSSRSRRGRRRSTVRAAVGSICFSCSSHLLPQSLVAEVELAQVRQPLGVALGDLVERLFHAGGELARPRGAGSASRAARVTANAVNVGTSAWPCSLRVAALEDGADDAGVGARPAHAVGLERLHQRRFGVARRRLRLVRQRLELLAGRRVAFLERRQDDSPGPRAPPRDRPIPRRRRGGSRGSRCACRWRGRRRRRPRWWPRCRSGAHRPSGWPRCASRSGRRGRARARRARPRSAA